jgi:hypothetical protein
LTGAGEGEAVIRAVVIGLDVIGEEVGSRVVGETVGVPVEGASVGTDVSGAGLGFNVTAEPSSVAMPLIVKVIEEPGPFRLPKCRIFAPPLFGLCVWISSWDCPNPNVPTWLQPPILHGSPASP